MGRSKLKAGEARTRIHSLRFRPRDERMMEAAAKATGNGLHAWMELTLLAQAAGLAMDHSRALKVERGA